MCAGRRGGHNYGHINKSDITKLRPHRSIQTNTTSSETFKQVSLTFVGAFSGMLGAMESELCLQHKLDYGPEIVLELASEIDR